MKGVKNKAAMAIQRKPAVNLGDRMKNDALAARMRSSRAEQAAAETMLRRDGGARPEQAAREALRDSFGGTRGLRDKLKSYRGR
jgi:hypothetical protein